MSSITPSAHAASLNRDAADNGFPTDLNHELTRGYAGRLIRYRAWKLAGTGGFSCSDRPDLEQELRIALIERIDKFDPQRGHWNVFVCTIIERAIASMFTRRRVAERMQAVETESLSSLVAADDQVETMLGQLVTAEQQARVSDRAVRHHVDEVDTVADVETVIASLPPHLREVARRLMTTSPTALARELKVPRRTLRDWIAEIREAFAQAGVGPAAACGGQ